MGLDYIAHKRKPWVLTWTDVATGRKRSRSFGDEVEARQYETVQADLADRERALLKRARRHTARTSCKISVGDLLDSYLTMHIMHETTRQSAQYHTRSLRALYGGRQAARLTPHDVATFTAAQTLRGIAPSTIHRRLAILRAALNWAVRRGLLATNPLAAIQVPTARSRRIAPPTPVEVRLLLQHAAPHIQRVIWLGLYTGARIGPSELYRLRWVDVDMDAGIVRMPSAAKNDGPDGRDVPLRADLIPHLQRWAADDAAQGCPWVIHYRGHAVRRLTHGWHNALRRAGITRRMRMYDLRHAFATYALAGGADIGSVAEIMAHRNVTMVLRTYQHVMTATKRAAVEALPVITL